MSANQAMLDYLLDRGRYLEMFTASEVARVTPILEAAAERIMGKIASSKGVGSMDWRAEIKAFVDEIYAQAVADIRDVLDPDLQTLAVNESGGIREAYEKTVPAIPFTAPDDADLWDVLLSLPAADGLTLDQLYDSMELGSAQAVMNEITSGLALGLTLEGIVSALDAITGGSGSIMQGVSMFIMTATSYAGTQAREAFYEANKELFKGFERVETLDVDTCIACGAEDGHIYEADEPRPDLPEHPNCRGVWVPVLKSYEELGLDAAKISAEDRAFNDGNPPEYDLYEDWLNRQSAEKQDAILGPSRGSMVRAGVPLSDMVSGGRTIPLKDLGKKGSE